MHRLLVISMLMLALAGCGGSAPASAGDSQPAPVASAAKAMPVRFISLNSANFAPLFIAMEKGYFRDAGVEAT